MRRSHILFTSCLILSWCMRGEAHVCSTTGEPICKNGGTCIPSFEHDYWSHHCLCSIDWTGSTCEIRDHCHDINCKHGGTCIPGPDDSEVCICTDGYTGKTCGQEVPSCGLNCKNGGTCTRPTGGAADSESCVCKPGYAGKTCDYESKCISISQNGSGGLGDKFTCFLATPTPPSSFKEAKTICAGIGEGWALACPRNMAEHATAIQAKRKMEKTIGINRQRGLFGYRGTKESLKSKDGSSFRCVADDTSLADTDKHFTTWHSKLGGGPEQWASFPTLKNSCVKGTMVGLFPGTCKKDNKENSSLGICSRTYNSGEGTDATLQLLSYDEAMESYQLSEDIDSPVIPFWEVDEGVGGERGLLGALSTSTAVVVGAALLATLVATVVLVRRRRRLMGSALLAEKEADPVDEEAAE